VAAKQCRAPALVCLPWRAQLGVGAARRAISDAPDEARCGTIAAVTPNSDRVFYARAFALAALALLVYLLYFILAPFFAPIAWALFIAFLAHPLHARLTRALRGRGSASSLLLTVLVLLLVLGPLTGLAAAFAAQAAELARYVQQFVVEHKPADASDLETLPYVGPAIAWLNETVGVSLAQIQAWAVQAAQAALKAAAGLGRAAFIGVVGTVVGFVLMMFILFFAIRDGARWAQTARELLPMSPAERRRLFEHLGSVTRAMVYGTGVTALVQGTLVGIGFAVVGLPSPLVFGVLAALAALVPMAGTPVVWVPATIVLATQGRWGASLFMLLWGAFTTTIDNFLRPWLVAGKAEIGALTVFIGVLGGVSAFGPIGIFLGPLVLALAIALIRFAQETPRD
jgi:predicted PurR-regulated permease PerM